MIEINIRRFDNEVHESPKYKNGDLKKINLCKTLKIKSSLKGGIYTKEILKKLMSSLLALSILFTFGGFTHVHAEEIKSSPENVLSLKNDGDLREFSIKMKDMSEPELQKIIYYAKIESENRSVNDILALKAAWLAAAQIARTKGYPLAASLVESSVWNNNYNETNGQFANAIKSTKVYSRMIQNARGSDSFEKSDNNDLFYAIHSFSYSSDSSSQGMRIWAHDVFDFALDSTYKSLFTSIVNNWAYLNQGIGVLNKIQVDIALDV